MSLLKTEVFFIIFIHMVFRHWIKEHPLAAVISVGLIIRVIFLVSYLSSAEWNHLIVDSLYHDRWAMYIASGNILGDEVYFRAPFYIYLLGGLYAIFGHSLLIARIFGHVLGLASVVITYHLGSRIFSHRTGIIAACIHAIYPIAIYFESELLVEGLFAFLVELSLLFFWKASTEGRSRDYIFSGIIIGLAAITRPVIMALVPLFVLWILIRSGGISRALGKVAIMVGAAGLMIFPITLRNFAVGNDPVLISSSGGINFFIGNNEHANGLSASMPPPLGARWQISDIKYLAEQETGKRLKPSQISSHWYNKGLQWITDNKADFLKPVSYTHLTLPTN